MSTMRGWQKVAGALVLTIACVQGLDQAIKTAPLPAPASRFVQYFEALEEAGDTSLIERLLYSWMLADRRF
jgi:hypothetical protein